MLARPTDLLMLLALVASLVVPAGSAMAGDPPRLSDPNNRIARSDLTGLLRLRFLTSLDFPPFNFADKWNRPAGFNVEIARAICAELKIEAKCEIQAMPWEELDPALDGLRGEAIIAGHGITKELRSTRAVSRPYFKFPARFVARSGFAARSTDMDTLARGRKVAVVEGSAHAQLLKVWFPEAEAVALDDEAATYSALLKGEADLIFGDGVALSFWLASPNADNCCGFVSGPFLSDHFLGDGMVIVMRQDSAQIVKALNAALNALEEKGVYREIYLRYFPLDPFADGIGMPKSEPRERQAERPQQSG
ncbi:transporter substrate-binding domain-containing protein [Oricola sp.]|uniref:transporter substrate-binding domain-containing protein n=1 Tax=Oricola sp. TaxID=1979950 RepID=UPI0025D00227|nr:transporter substrate-binding domain-containing protein [Oricola sp.]MCI5078164.1 transporter substrate-binding domain-containing protein [Oricola sp.]